MIWVRQRLPRLIGWLFGTLWAQLGAFALPFPYNRAGCALAVVVAVVLLARLWRHETPAVASRSLFRTPGYRVAVTAEVLGIYTASLLLPRFGEQQQVYSAVGCIVGLHFIGLWIATRSSRYIRITVGMCIVSLLSMTVPFTWRAIGLRYLLLGAGNAIVLWLAASGSDSNDQRAVSLTKRDLMAQE